MCFDCAKLHFFSDMDDFCDLGVPIFTNAFDFPWNWLTDLG